MLLPLSPITPLALPDSVVASVNFDYSTGFAYHSQGGAAAPFFRQSSTQTIRQVQSEVIAVVLATFFLHTTKSLEQDIRQGLYTANNHKHQNIKQKINLPLYIKKAATSSSCI